MYNIPYAGYKQLTGLIFTRYAIHAITMQYGNGTGTGSIGITRISSYTGYDTLTGSVSGSKFTIKSASGWNNFFLIASHNQNPPLDPTAVITISSLSKT